MQVSSEYVIHIPDIPTVNTHTHTHPFEVIVDAGVLQRLVLMNVPLLQEMFISFALADRRKRGQEKGELKD